MEPTTFRMLAQMPCERSYAVSSIRFRGLQTYDSETKLATFLLYSLQKEQNKNPKQSQFFKMICFETNLSCHHLPFRPLFDAAWKALCKACVIDMLIKLSQQIS